jgi:hypothetical protein
MAKSLQDPSKDNKPNKNKCTNCKKKGHTKEKCWAKGGGKEGQGPKQSQNKKSKKKKGREKVHTVNEASASSSDKDNDMVFTNSPAIFLTKNDLEFTHILDTGVSAHMAPHKNLLRSYKIFNTPKHISATNKGTFNALGVGTMVLPTKINGKDHNIISKDMLYAPAIAFTLISIGRCNDAGYKTMFVDQKCTIKNKASSVLLKAPKYHRLYCINQEPAEFTAYTCLNPIKIYKQLRHISEKSMRRLFEHRMIQGFESKPSKEKLFCDRCIKSNIT